VASSISKWIVLRKYKPEETLLLQYLGASPTLRMVDFFLDNPLSDYSKNEVARNLAMSRATFFKYWKVLEKSGAVRTTRQIGRATLYELDRQNDIVKQLIKLDAALARKSMERAIEASQRKTVAIESRSN
jgi:DNA-binding transcriptional ArsR family regulator